MSRKRILAVAAASLLSACVSQIYHHQLVALDKGMTADAATARLKEPPISVHTVTVDQASYRFHRYTMNNGMDAAPYLLAFEDGKLKYWGYIDEFRRHPDRRLNQAVEQVMAELRAKK